MIIQKEIINAAEEKGVPKSTIDQDWILGHLLNAMYSFNDTKENFVFKGGTCLKKCYFEGYRFSEDLDFTLLDKNFSITKDLINKFIRKAEKSSGAKLYLSEIKKQKSDEVPQGYEITIKFWGADHKPNQRPLPVSRWQSKITLDISFSEQLILKPENKKILHPYSDLNLIDKIIPVYSINEFLAEKLRSLIQRNRPRDIYDIWTLSKFIDNKNLPEIKRVLFQKSVNKNIAITGINNFVNEDKRKKNNRAWKKSLKHQLSKEQLPNFDEVYNQILEFIKTILNTK